MTHHRDDLTKKLRTAVTGEIDERTDADGTDAPTDDESVEGHAVNFRPLDNGPGRRRSPD